MFVMSLISTSVYAGFRLPECVYTLDQLKVAQDEARGKNKALTILYTHTSTTCGACRNASLDTVWKLKTKSVIVYVDCDTEGGKLPKIVYQALCTPEAGKYVPRVVILDPDMTKVIYIIPYARPVERSELFKEARKKIRAEMPKKR